MAGAMPSVSQGSCDRVSCRNGMVAAGDELGVPKASAWQGVTTRLALRSQQSGARGRAPQARSAAPKHQTTPPQIGTFTKLAAPEHHKTPPHIGTFMHAAPLLAAPPYLHR